MQYIFCNCRTLHSVIKKRTAICADQDPCNLRPWWWHICWVRCFTLRDSFFQLVSTSRKPINYMVTLLTYEYYNVIVWLCDYWFHTSSYIPGTTWVINSLLKKLIHMGPTKIAISGYRIHHVWPNSRQAHPCPCCGCVHAHRMWPHPVISWFLKPIKYSNCTYESLMSIIKNIQNYWSDVHQLSYRASGSVHCWWFPSKNQVPMNSSPETPPWCSTAASVAASCGTLQVCLPHRELSIFDSCDEYPGFLGYFMVFQHPSRQSHFSCEPVFA